ncbi:Two component system response regulator receiver and adenyl cyclase domains-containing protein [Desulfonema limicola]|uniref:Two component system response regulator receiver and adenyl cyclase domains-containing protein n=1 Tax=Desulfonema limicola TaxID=45656 RepID=A0A975GKM9_9BACT|nr:adenylate/guanylate cyclase domain-containing protein [Desulfonema limicola]QTA83953.1 Two component system response regulator receiver and adenyl cyclase domains-containing protein [Desulfonema limicola]
MTKQPVLKEHRITVLLVDDQKMIGESVRRMLTGEKDIDFHYCQDPTQAIKAANQISPTVILQDLVMPEMDGLRLVRYFRANPPTREVPLIVLSGEEDARIKAEAFALGANDYMVKLPDHREVIARIRYHSKGYINLLERNEAYKALLESQKQLEIRNSFIRKTFGRYLSDDVVDSILESPEGTRLGGEKRRVTIMMSDLRGFTSIGERLPAENVLSMINIYLETMTEIILKYQGTIDEFIGDAILVIFGAPILREDDALRAAACAVEMQLAMKQVNARNNQKGYPPVAQGIGINTGDLVVGNIGSEKRSKYGVVGSNVNLTSRIESYTVGGQILISETTLEACGQILRIDDKMQVMPKGVKNPITIYELGGIGGRFNLFMPEKEKTNLPKLKKNLPVRLSIIEGKYTANEFLAGSIIKMNADMADISAESQIDRHSNIKLSLFNNQEILITENLYAKVIQNLSENPSVFRIQFTSIPPEAEEFLKQELA